MKVILNAANIIGLFGKSRKSILTKIGAETEDDARKAYGVDFSVHKRSNNMTQNHIATSVGEQ